MNQGPRKPQNNIGQQLADALKKSADQVRTRQASGEEPTVHAAPDPMKMAISKPDDQNLGEAVINWVWNHNRYIVMSYYARNDENIERMPAGSYWVSIDFSDDYPLTKDDAKSIAETLMSAYRWADIWQNYMGEFFAARPKTKIKAVPDPDDEDDEEDEDDDEDEKYDA